MKIFIKHPISLQNDNTRFQTLDCTCHKIRKYHDLCICVAQERYRLHTSVVLAYEINNTPNYLVQRLKHFKQITSRLTMRKQPHKLYLLEVYKLELAQYEQIVPDVAS